MATPTRRIARETALQILYRYDAPVATSTERAPPVASNGRSISEGSALTSELSRHFDHFQVSPPAREFAAELVAGTLRHLSDIDASLEKHAQNWKLGRMSAIDRNLLRMASFELVHLTDIPAKVTIDDAVELAKVFGTADSPAFVNGVLDAIRKASGRE